MPEECGELVRQQVGPGTARQARQQVGPGTARQARQQWAPGTARQGRQQWAPGTARQCVQAQPACPESARQSRRSLSRQSRASSG